MRKDQVEILVVEDDPDDLELTMRALAEENICNRIQIARDGEEALQYLFCVGPHVDRDRDQNPRLVLLDMKLPKIDGLEVLQAIKDNPATRSIPVVLLTSSRQEKDMVRGYRLGANSYIQKPVDFEQFRRTIKELGYYWILINQPPPQEGTTEER